MSDTTHTNLRKVFGVGALVAALLLTSCSSEEDLKSLGGSGNGNRGGDTTPSTEPSPNPMQSDPSSPTTVTGDGPPMHSRDPEPTPPASLATRPAGIPSQEWWVRGDVMKWWFGNETDFTVSPETLIGIWGDPNNSDVGDPAAAAQLAEGGKNVTLEWLTTNPAGQVREILAPAQGVTIQGAAVAKAYRTDGGPQLYRVAVLWSAEKDREFQRPVANQMVEMYFSGAPGNWTRVPCEQAGPSMCVPLFQTII